MLFIYIYISDTRISPPPLGPKTSNPEPRGLEGFGAWGLQKHSGDHTGVQGTVRS